jgi:hypothetical protein
VQKNFNKWSYRLLGIAVRLWNQVAFSAAEVCRVIVRRVNVQD